MPRPTVYDEEDWSLPAPDATPTALEPVVTVTPSTDQSVPPPATRRPRRAKRWPVVVGALVPVVVFLTGLALFRYAGVWHDRGTGNPASGTPTTLALPTAPATIAITGDPLHAAATLTGAFADLLAAGDWVVAAETTGNRPSSHLLAQLYSWGPRSHVLIGIQPISRNAYAVRVLLSGGNGDKVRYSCERWLVDPTAQAVVPDARDEQFGADRLSPSPDAEPSPEQLAVAAAEHCRGASLG